MKVYLLWASRGSYDERVEKILGAFSTEEKAEEAKSKTDEKYKTQDYYKRIYTDVEEKEIDVLEDWGY